MPAVPPIINYVDFDTLSEPWIKYNLSDGTRLLLRLIATNIIRTGQYDPFGKPIYGILSNTIQVVRAPKDLRGQPTIPPPNPEQLGASVVADVNASAENDEWNMYKCDDGSTLQIKAQVVSIKRTAKYDGIGEPIYIVSTQNLMKDDIPKTLWKKSNPSTAPNYGI